MRLIRQRVRERDARHLAVDVVASWLLIGPALSPYGYAGLASRGVTHVVDLRWEAVDDQSAVEWLGLAWLRLPIRDGQPPTVRQVDQLVTWLAQRAAPRTRVYLHCEAGLGRAPTVAIALLVLDGLPLAEASARVHAARRESALTPAQLAWLRAAHGGCGPRP